MQKYIFTLFFLVFYYCQIFPQKKIDGKYYDESGFYIEVVDKHFKMSLPNYARNGYNSEILAEGIIQPINGSFIELNSLKDPFLEASKTLKIREEANHFISNDSLKIKIIIPYTMGNLIIMAFTSNFKQNKFYYSSQQTEFTIPFQGGNISFQIYPDYIMPHTAEGSFYGILEYNTLDFTLEKGINYIEINIPTIDNSFFEKYYIKGEYARIIDDNIIWKGKVFKKKSK